MEFRRGNAVRLDFPDETFDVVTSNYVYHNIPGNRQDVLLETLRTLKRSGTFAIHDIFSSAKYGNMDAFLARLRDMGYAEARLADTMDGTFMNRTEARQLMLSGSALLMGVLSIRSILSYGLLAFIPLFLMGVLGQDAALSSLVISAFAIAGGVATLLSGRVSGRVGTHRLMIGCIAATVLLAVVFSLNRSLVVAVALAMLLAVSTDLFYPSAVALGMSYVPAHLGMASGLSYGIAVCVGGVAEPFLGAAGDAIGLPPVIMALVGLAALGVVLALILTRLDARPSQA